MPTIVMCPNCATGLSVPDHLLGKTVRCPRCREAVRTAGAPVPVSDPTPAPAAALNQPAADFRFGQDQDAVMARAPETARAPEPMGSARAERSRWDDDDDEDLPRRRKKKKKKSRREGRMSSDQVRWLIGGGLSVVGIIIGIWVLVALFRTPGPRTIPDEKWQTVEVPNRLRVSLPGPSERVTQAVAGVQMVVFICRPEKGAEFGVLHTEGQLPPHRAKLPGNVLLHDVAHASAANM